MIMTLIHCIWASLFYLFLIFQCLKKIYYLSIYLFAYLFEKE